MASNNSTVPYINLVPSAEWLTDCSRISGKHTGHQTMDMHMTFCGNASHGINTNCACNRASDRHGPSLVVAWTWICHSESLWLRVVVWPMGINIASGCSTNHQNLHDLSWQHRPWATILTAVRSHDLDTVMALRGSHTELDIAIVLGGRHGVDHGHPHGVRW